MQAETSVNDGVFDAAFGIRISNPKVGVEVINNHCYGMKKIRASQLCRSAIPQNDEWATMAVIVNKSNCRKSANGNEYLIWQVSDLTNTQDTPAKVVLFSDCVKQHWKLQVGLVVLIINPQIDFDTSKGLTLKLNKESQVVDIGFCPDFGSCKALKQDGNPCTLFVNLSKSDYCAYHIQNAARQVSARRGAFNSTSNIPPKSWRLKDPSASQESISGLKTVSRDGPMRRFVKPVALHNKLKNKTNKDSTATKLPTNPSANKDFAPKSNGVKRKSADPVQAAATAPQPAIKRVKSMKEFISSQQDQPNLGSRAQLGFVNLFSPEKKLKTKSQLIEEAKIRRSAEILRRSRENLVNKNANSCGPKRSICVENDKDLEATEDKPKSRSAFDDSDILALLNKKSKYASEALEDMQSRQEKYFKVAEAEEKVESNATSLMEIKNCKVVTCQSCDYTSVHQSEYCRTLGHLVKRHTADKRFFKCKNCQTRVSCFKLMPTKPCQTCLMIDYERVAMRDERKVNGEKLQIRGEERKYIN